MQPTRLAREQGRALRDLRDTAVHLSGFCARHHAGLGRAPHVELPPVTKADLMAHFNDVSTDAALTLDRATDHLRRLRASEADPGRPLDARWWVARTAGRSGEPATFVWGRREWATVLASYARAVRWAQVPVGLMHPLRTAIVSTLVPTHQSAVVAASLRAPFATTLRLDARAPSDELVAALDAFRPSLLVGYASALGRSPARATERFGCCASRAGRPSTSSARKSTRSGGGRTCPGDPRRPRPGDRPHRVGQGPARRTSSSTVNLTSTSPCLSPEGMAGADTGGMTMHLEHTHAGAQAAPAPAVPPGGRRSVGAVLAGGLGAVSGVAPHVLHHVGPLVGTALVAGAGGTALFAALGLVASVPLLLRLRRRFGSWWAPVIALAVFTAMFLLSTFVIGPLISGDDAPADVPSPQDTPHDDSHHE